MGRGGVLNIYYFSFVVYLLKRYDLKGVGGQQQENETLDVRKFSGHLSSLPDDSKID